MADSVPCRAAAALYVLLVGHPVDRRGRCRSCRRPGAVFGWLWRRCRVHNEARVWLHQPLDFVAARLARELGLPAVSLPGDQAATQVLPQIAAADDPLNAPQPPVAPLPLALPGGFPTAGRPDPDHRPPAQGRSLLLVEAGAAGPMVGEQGWR